MTIADRISDVRQQRGMSMTNLANFVGVTTSAVSNWESGNTVPRNESLEKVAKVLGVTRQFLETGEGQADAPMDVLSILARAKQHLSLATGVAEDKIQLDFRIQG